MNFKTLMDVTSIINELCKLNVVDATKLNLEVLDSQFILYGLSAPQSLSQTTVNRLNYYSWQYNSDDCYWFIDNRCLAEQFMDNLWTEYYEDPEADAWTLADWESKLVEVSDPIILGRDSQDLEIASVTFSDNSVVGWTRNLTIDDMEDVQPASSMEELKAYIAEYWTTID